MKNRFRKTVLAVMLSFSLTAIPTYAQEKYYHITYTPGLLGSFTSTLIEGYESTYGKEDVTVSQATGSVTIKVAANEDMPNAPTASDITFKNLEDVNQYYVKTEGWQSPSTKVNQNETLVVQYGALVKGVDYTIRFVDNVTNTDVATPVMGKANVDETIAAYAKVIAGYTFDSQSKTTVLTENANQNIITFYYTAEDDAIYVDEEITNVIPGETVVVTNPVADDTTNNEVVDDNETPLANVDEEVVEDNETPLANADEEKIEDNETPLASNEELQNNNMMLYVGIGAVVVLGILIAFFAKKKKKAEE